MTCARRIGFILAAVGCNPVARLPMQPGDSDIASNGRARSPTSAPTSAVTKVPIELGPVTRNGARGAGTSVYFRDPDGSLLDFMSYE